MLDVPQIVLHLEGHTHPVRDLAEFWFPRAQGNMPNILTMDDTVRSRMITSPFVSCTGSYHCVSCQGVFKVWDLVPVRAGQATCLMTIRLDMLTGVMCPEAFAFMGSTCTILTGRNRLQLFSVREFVLETVDLMLCVIWPLMYFLQPNAVSDADVIPIASVYNPLTMRFVTGVDSSFRVCTMCT